MTGLLRRPDWPSRLAAYLAAADGHPFAWGRRDCCLFAADGIVAMTDADPIGVFRGAYDSWTGAIRALRAHVGPDGRTAEHLRLAWLLSHVVGGVAAAWGAPEVAVGRAWRGDVVWLAPCQPSDLVGSIGLVDLDGRRAVFQNLSGGLARLPLKSCARAWRLPVA